VTHSYEVVASTTRFAGRIFDVVTDQVRMPDGGVAARDCVRHPGAVAVVALDGDDRVLLIRQYRHPVGRSMWELPAGLRDVAGEDPQVTAARELAEEVDLVAERWQPLLALHPSPGCSDELIQIFLARGLTAVDAEEQHSRTDEEADLQLRWVTLDHALAMITAGEITNATCVAGLYAAVRAGCS